MANDPKIEAAFNAEVAKTNMSMEAQAEIQEAINAGLVKSTQQLKTLVGIVTKVADKHKGIVKELTKEEQLTQDIADNEYKILDIASTLNGKIKGNKKEFIGIGKQAILTAASLKLQYKAQLKSGALTKAAYKELVAIADETGQIAMAMETIAASGMGDVYDEAIGLAEGLTSKLQGIFSSIPGGDYLFQALGGNELNALLQKAVTEGFGAMAASMAAGNGMLASMTAGMRAFNAVVMMNPFVAIAAAIIGVIALIASAVSIAGDWEDASREIAENTGMTVGQAMKLKTEAMVVATTLDAQLATSKDILAVQSEIANEFGIQGMMAPEVASDTAEIGKAFGYGATEAAKVSAQFMNMGMSAGEAADMQRELAAESLKAGVNVGGVMKDIQQNSKKVSKYFGGNVKALKKAAIEAAKMGVSLDTMGNVADNLLNFEESISAQFELQALTGKNMNFDLARQLALEGNIAGATEEVLNQVGSISDFNSMGYLERKKLAEATGMEVDELQKSLTIRDKLGSLTDEELAAYSGLNLSAAEMSNMSAEQLQTALADQQAKAKSAKQFSKMKDELMKSVLPLAQKLLGIFEAISPIFSILGKVIGAAFAPIEYAVEKMGELWDFVTQTKETAIAAGVAFAAILMYQNASFLVTQGSAALDLLRLGYENARAAKLAITASIEKKGLWNTITGAAMSAFRSLSAIPVVGAALGAVAAAGAVALGMKYMGGDDVVSRPSGGSSGGGYGSRTLFGPEGAISFNNKDTIVAGTNLQYGNDVISAPKGAMRMDDGAVGDIPDPPEAKIIGISSTAAMMIGLSMGNVLGTKFGTALLMSMPAIGATITTAIVSAAAMTALVPKPVLILNPVIPTFETNPMTFALGNILGSLFGGGDDKENPFDAPADRIVKKLDKVEYAIENMEITMDGEKVGTMSRIIDSFRRK